jgi:hypothetical protein
MKSTSVVDLFVPKGTPTRVDLATVGAALAANSQLFVKSASAVVFSSLKELLQGGDLAFVGAAP